MQRTRIQVAAAIAVLFTGLAASHAAMAQTGWAPKKPIRLVIPYPPGGATDVAARAVVQRLGERMGQPMVVDNRPGANGIVASEHVFNQAPDGHTLLMATADTHSINPNVYTNLRFQAREFRAASPVAKVSFILAGRPGIAAKTAPELVELARKSGLSFSTWGVGSTSQAAMEMFKASTGLTMLHVPFQGAAPAFQALLGGQVDLMFAPVTIVMSNRAKVTVFGISSTQRYEGASDIATLAEQGHAVDADAWIGMLAPPKTPDAALAHIHKYVNEVVSEPDMKKRLLEIGLSAHTMPLPQFASYLASEYERWGKVVRAAGIKLEN